LRSILAWIAAARLLSLAMLHPLDRDTHATGAARDGANGSVKIGRRQIGLLGLGNFFGLSACQGADLVGVRTSRTLLNARSLLDQDSRRRRLHDEGEALVGVGGDHHWNRQTWLHALGLGVERLAEFHDVQATLTQSRAN